MSIVSRRTVKSVVLSISLLFDGHSTSAGKGSRAPWVSVHGDTGEEPPWGFGSERFFGTRGLVYGRLRHWKL